MTIHITLHSSDTARCQELSLEITKTRGSPIGALCREILDAGLSPSSLVYIYRGETLCFKPRSLGRWAGVTTEERDSGSVREIPYRPMTPQAVTALRYKGATVHEGT